MASCAVTSVIAKDPRFQSLKDAYKDKHYSDDHLAQGLQLCREYHAYNDDWFPETSAQRNIFTRFMNHYLVNAKLAKTDSNMSRDSVYNLYTTLYSVYTPEQLDNRVNMIAQNFRDLIDRLEKNDRRGRSRQEIIKAFGDKNKNGYQKLIEKVFDIYEKNYTDVDKMMDSYIKANPNATEQQKEEARKSFEYRAQEFKTLLANKERLAAIASTRIGEEEGFVVNIKDFQVSFEDTKETQLSDGNTETAENSGEDNEEGSKGDRYGDFRTLKLLNTLSPRARRLISRVPKVDSNGNQVRDDIGVAQYIGGRQVATVLKRVLVNSSPDTMMSDLAAATDFYPWIKGIIDVLENNTDEQTTIYANFKNAETTYVYTAFENGRYVPKIANSRSGGYALMREAGNNLRAGYVMDDATSIYTGYGALKSLEEIQKVKAQFEDIRKRIQSAEGTMWIRMVNGDKPLQSKRIEEIIENGTAEGKDLSYLREAPEDAMHGFLHENPDIADKLASLLRGIGFAVSENDVKTIATQTMTPKGFRFLAGYIGSKSQKGRNKLYQLVEYMNSVYGRSEEIYKKNLPATGQYLYNTSDGFKRINSALALSQYKEVEARVVNEGKSLATYNNVNLLHQTFDELTNKQNLSEENYQEYLENEYLQYEGMALGYGDRKQVYGWLKELQDNKGNIRENLRVIDAAAFNHVEYAELSRSQKLTNSLVMYLEGGRTFQQDGYALYEVPIQADYSTAYNFILAPKYGEESMIVDALTNEVLIELERIAAIESRQNDPNRDELNVYEKQGMKFQIFPDFNNNGFREQYSQIENAEDALNFVKTQVAQQLTDIISKDFATIEKAKILSNPAMKKVDLGYGNYGSMFSENNRISDLDEKAVNALRMYALNVFYARQQMTKLLVGGTEQFNGLIDFEKRNMLTHATRSSLNTKATWNGVSVGKDTQNVVYVEDDESESAFLNDIKEMLQQLLDNKVISKSQFDTMIKSYSNINTTDGQGFRTLESYRCVQIMSGQWDKAHEKAYRAIISGNPSKEDISVFMQNIKPVLTGYETIKAAAGENQKPVKATVLHKYSEAVLLPMALSKYCLQNQSVPLQAFERAQQRLKKQGKEIDMFLFHSGVKVGAHSVIQPFAKKDGQRIISDAKSIEDYIVNSVIGKESVMHTLPFKYYGIAASTPAHVVNDKIAWASQAEKVAWANILKGQKIRVHGKEMDAWDARELYFDIKTANIVESFKQIREFFADSDKLEKIFQEELASKSYSSSELQYALAHLQDGTFAVPLYSPNVEHQVQELLSSIIKKRLTKPKVKGANILQTTGIGMDIEASSFDNNNALSEDQKLKVVFEGTGANKRIKYVEVYMPIHDSRLKMFADKDGNIGPERLKELVDKGIIPETILEFIAYRTPSDAEHSVIPCRIKGFVANTGGATIRMPKEIMVMTGHDYDGDKMRCHFKDFKLVDKEGSELDLSDEDIALMVHGQKDINPSFRKVEAYEYDYDKPAIENSLKARNNARVELMFSELTSPAGSQRMIIPGGCDETKIIAKSLYLVRSAENDEVKAKIEEVLVNQGTDARTANSIVRKPTSLYDALIRKSNKQLSEIVREVSSTETPFSVTHSSDAFDYIMGGSQMIGIYATYNSALQMLQRLDMNYIPALTKQGKPYTVTLFGNTFDKLFAVNNHSGRLASLGLARLLNAAVDNNKDPILGYLNQTKEMSEMTFLMFAAGMTEEEIHLIMNQPSVIELINRLKDRNSKGLVAEIKNLIDELSANSQELGEITPWIALDKIKLMEREDYIRNLGSTHESVRTGDDFTTIQQQIYVLQTLRHLEPAASNLATFVRLTRPESESGAIGTSISDIIAKVTELNKFRNTLALGEDNDIRISGMREVLEKRDVNGGWDTSYIEEIIGSRLPEVVALNSLMLDSSLDMFKPLFPQAKDDWVNLAAEIANQYSYNKVQEGTISKIMQEMILWKLLSNKKFITGNPQEEQKRIIIDVPKNLKDIKQRIAKAAQKSGSDPAAEELIGNAFLNNLTTTDPQNSSVAPRLRFSLNGAPAEGTRDLISSSWNAMLSSSDKKIKDLAIDLFKYNLYTNGFSYGMYEFAHFAPFSVLMSTPGYIEALQDVLKSNWSSDEERENFINQYYMNHWGDKKFIPQYNIKALTFASSSTGSLVLSKQNNDDKVIDKIKDLRYIVLRSGEKGEVQTLYRVIPGASDTKITLIKAQKLGVRNRSQQLTLQYNPTLNYNEVTPVVPGNDSAWGQLDELNVYAEGDINASGQRSSNPNPFGIVSNATQPLGLNFFGIKPVATQIQKLEEKAEPAAQKNEGNIPETPPAPTIADMPMPMSDAFGLGVMDMDALQSAVARTSTEDNDVSTSGKMLNIVRRDENGNIVSENVPATPANISQARKQKTFVELNKKLRDILRSKGIDVGVLTNAEAMMSLGGVADFDTANVTAEGLLEMIRIAEGYEGEQALPEEFAHVAIEMLGHDHPLVKRLLAAIENSPEALNEAYGEMYSEYVDRYGEENHDKLVLEAAGKLVAKQLFRQQEIETKPVRRLIQRVIDAIKSLFRKFRREEVQNAIFDANDIASKLAREMLGGKLLDQMSVMNINQSGLFQSVKKDITNKNDILSKLLKNELKRLSILKRREGYRTKDKQSKSITATEMQITKLESAIRNYKTEDAIVTYMSDSLAFLAAMEKSLDDAVNSGRPVNTICKKLNMVRDTLYSFSQAIEDVRESIREGEVQDNIGIEQSLAQVANVLANFHQKYEGYARTYFEEMLSNVYGEHGKTVTVGREKGRKISIHEMATKSDHDISLISRWFNSLADCNDYVLRAIDDVTRDAKIKARRRAAAIRPKIELAISELEKATGSRDQSFMFETKVGDDGKVHRTGKYISKKAAENLSEAQQRFYNTMMDIKKEVDQYIPDSLLEDRKIIMLRKYTMDKFKDAEGAKGKALEAWDGLKNRVMDTSDNIDFENYEVAVDFEGNRVDMLPVKFLLKGKKESYDDMTDDVATSMMAYSGMAIEYNELNNVIGILENAKFMASERDVAQRTGTRKQRETITTDNYIFHAPFTKKQAVSNAQKALEDFFQMHIYGHIQKNEGTIGNTRISKRKVVDTINMITSYSQMAINIPQRIANVSTGVTQIAIESVGNGVFSSKDIRWANKIYLKESGDRLAETGKTDYDNKLSLWDEYFDVHQNNGRNQTKYKKGRMSRIFNSSLLYAGLTMGEDYLASTTSLAIAHTIKVKNPNGETESLWDAYEVKYANPDTKTGAYLALKNGYTKEDGSPITFEDEKRFSKLSAGMNFELQGIYNLDDRSAVQQYAFGALIIMYRKWIAPALKRRYSGVNYNLLKGDYQEGYHRTMFRFANDMIRDAKDQVTEEEGAKALLNIIADMKALKTSILINWKKLNDYERSNVKRSLTELGIVAGLWISCAILGKVPPPDYGDDEPGVILKWFDQTLMSQMLRLRTEIGSQAPTPMLVDEALHVLKSPFAAIAPLQNTINALNLFIPSNYFTEIKSGRYKGHSKSYKYFRELPIISMFKKVDNFIDPSSLISYYKNDVIM